MAKSKCPGLTKRSLLTSLVREKVRVVFLNVRQEDRHQPARTSSPLSHVTTFTGRTGGSLFMLPGMVDLETSGS